MSFSERRYGKTRKLQASKYFPSSTGKERRGKSEWGEGFPWIASYLDGLLGNTQKEVFLSWISHFYNNAVNGSPKKGHAMFIAGDVSAGKTFLAHQIVGQLMGGCQDASNYLLGNTQFNESLFYSPVWTVDDAVAASDAKRHAEYSQMVKKIAANHDQEFHPKFKKAVSFPFHGRLIVTMNDDPDSIGMLPGIERSILDKLVIIQARKTKTDFSEGIAKAGKELPEFSRYLSFWRIPDWLMTKPDEVIRFGHDAWQNVDLINTAKDSSSSSALMEILEFWRVQYFRQSDDDTWTGGSVALLAELSTTDTISSVATKTLKSSIHLGRLLQKLIAQDIKWIHYRREASFRVYIIDRPAK